MGHNQGRACPHTSTKSRPKRVCSPSVNEAPSACNLQKHFQLMKLENAQNMLTSTQKI